MKGTDSANRSMEIAGIRYPWVTPKAPNPRAKDSLRDCWGARGTAAGFCGIGVGGGLMRTSKVPMRTLTPPSELELLRSLEVLEARARPLGALGVKVAGAARCSRGRESTRISGSSGGGILKGGVRLAEMSGGGRAEDTLACVGALLFAAGAAGSNSATTRLGDRELAVSRAAAAPGIAPAALLCLLGRSVGAAGPMEVMRWAPPESVPALAAAPRTGDSLTDSTKPLASAVVSRNITGGGRSADRPLPPSANRAR
jgi:hypothetical protein